MIGRSRRPTGARPRPDQGHQHLKEVGLIRMNGRIYDPPIARFMSADPFLRDPTNSRDSNRHTRVNN